MSTTVMSNPLEYHEIFKVTGEHHKMEEITNLQIGHLRNDSSSNDTYSESIVNHCTISNDHVPLQRSYTSLVNLIEQHRKLDRSISEPTSRYKTELCRPFEENGSCKYGDKCQFAHGYNELRNLTRHPKYKTELCRTFHKIGFCPYGPRCHFVHNFEEARIHNSKAGLHLNNQFQQQHTIKPSPSFVANFGSLMQPSLNVNVNLLEQLVASPQVAAAVAAAAATSVASSGAPLMRTNSLTLASSRYGTDQQQQTMHRSASVGMPVLIPSRPKPLDLSPTLSLGSTADSISPASSLSQSPTNSMASFFNEESGSIGVLPATYVFNKESKSIETGTAFITARQSQSPFQTLREELDPRTPSPLSPGAESRLPVFNRISGTLLDFEGLRI